MEDVNYTVLVGRLTRDAELKYTNSGLAVSSFAIAVNSRKRNGDNYEDEVNFFDLAMFGKRAESLNQYLNKGQQVIVECSLKQDRWEQEGQKRSKIKLLVNNIQLLGGKNSSQNAVTGQESHSQGYSPQNPPPPVYQNFDDDIPFG